MRILTRLAAVALTGLGLAAAAPQAQAGYYSPTVQPVYYYGYAPSYYAPPRYYAPRYVAPPVYYAPRPRFYGPPPWARRHHHHYGRRW